MLNHIVLMGRLTRDPELRSTQSGTPVASFTLAVDRDFGSRDGGERQTDFIDIVAWRSTAEFVSKYFSKGRMAVVSGRLQIRQWQDKEGNNRRTAEVVADNIYFGESKRDGQSGGSYGSQSSYGSQGGYGTQSGSYASYSAPAPAPQPQAPVRSSDFADLSEDDGELPF
jgi:single-strand DNA-binding protein